MMLADIKVNPGGPLQLNSLYLMPVPWGSSALVQVGYLATDRCYAN